MDGDLDNNAMATEESFHNFQMQSRPFLKKRKQSMDASTYGKRK